MAQHTGRLKHHLQVLAFSPLSEHNTYARCSMSINTNYVCWLRKGVLVFFCAFFWYLFFFFFFGISFIVLDICISIYCQKYGGSLPPYPLPTW